MPFGRASIFTYKRRKKFRQQRRSKLDLLDQEELNMKGRLVAPLALAGSVAALFFSQIEVASSQFFGGGGSFGFNASDPGVRGDPAGAGGPIAGLTANQQAFFDSGLADFSEAEEVDEGLGPRMNLDSCSGCHLQPAVGGTSPFVNPQVAFASKDGGTDKVPSFISANGPVREARFVKNPDGTADGGVHALFTITGRTQGDRVRRGREVHRRAHLRHAAAGEARRRARQMDPARRQPAWRH